MVIFLYMPQKEKLKSRFLLFLCYKQQVFLINRLLMAGRGCYEDFLFMIELMGKR